MCDERIEEEEMKQKINKYLMFDINSVINCNRKMSEYIRKSHDRNPNQKFKRIFLIIFSYINFFFSFLLAYTNKYDSRNTTYEWFLDEKSKIWAHFSNFSIFFYINKSLTRRRKFTFEKNGTFFQRCIKILKIDNNRVFKSNFLPNSYT